MQFLFIDWLDSLVAWRPPGVPISGVCRECEDSRLRSMGVLAVLPHDLLHEFVTDVEGEIVARGGASIDERDVYSAVEAILPEVAEVWEQHASPRLRTWIDEHIDDLDYAILGDLLGAPSEFTE